MVATAWEHCCITVIVARDFSSDHKLIIEPNLHLFIEAMILNNSVFNVPIANKVDHFKSAAITQKI